MLIDQRLLVKVCALDDFQDSKPTETFRARLDQWWFCLETMGTGSYADKQMEVEHYYLDYPSLALSYLLKQGFYAHPLVRIDSVKIIAGHLPSDYHLRTLEMVISIGVVVLRNGRDGRVERGGMLGVS